MEKKYKVHWEVVGETTVEDESYQDAEKYVRHMLNHVLVDKNTFMKIKFTYQEDV